MSAIGSMVPISLFPYMMEMSAVSARARVSTSSTCTSPYVSTGMYSTSYPSLLSASVVARTDECSIADMSRCFRSVFMAPSTPRSASVLDSVPPLVNTISDARAPMARATSIRACRSASLASRPLWWIDDGFPYTSRR
jgi:hypothetical protein